MTECRSQENDDYDSAGSNGSTPSAIRSPSPSENLSGHPFFRQEFSLPFDEICESLISSRRVRVSISPPSSPHVLSPARKSRGNRTKRVLNKSDMAGLVGGDSDSSALTQESGDEEMSPILEQVWRQVRMAKQRRRLTKMKREKNQQHRPSSREINRVKLRSERLPRRLLQLCRAMQKRERDDLDE